MKRPKGEAAAQPSRASDREKLEEREKIRAEAAGRRQERAGRRRGEDEAAEETPKPSTSAKTSPPASSQPTSPPETNGTETIPIKKGPGGKRKKLGNNQYTNKARGEASPPHNKKRNPLGTSSGEENLANGDSHQESASGTRKNSPDTIPVGKPKIGRGRKAINGNGTKHEDPADLTVATMKRRLEAMAAFIARAQVELAGDKTPSPQEVGAASPGALLPPGGAVMPPTPVATSANPGMALGGGRPFEEMNALEMAEVVARSIAGWQGQFGHLS